MSQINKISLQLCWARSLSLAGVWTLEVSESQRVRAARVECTEAQCYAGARPAYSQSELCAAWIAAASSSRAFLPAFDLPSPSAVHSLVSTG